MVASRASRSLPNAGHWPASPGLRGMSGACAARAASDSAGRAGPGEPPAGRNARETASVTLGGGCCARPARSRPGCARPCDRPLPAAGPAVPAPLREDGCELAAPDAAASPCWEPEVELRPSSSSQAILTPVSVNTTPTCSLALIERTAQSSPATDRPQLSRSPSRKRVALAMSRLALSVCSMHALLPSRENRNSRNTVVSSRRRCTSGGKAWIPTAATASAGLAVDRTRSIVGPCRRWLISRSSAAIKNGEWQGRQRLYAETRPRTAARRAADRAEHWCGEAASCPAAEAGGDSSATPSAAP
mmetsp:Transcript_15451/g.58508  ORF Transcript_15451/g.58508 Transcript_15451/m.58508 type:complete len:303 (+) Transcript_15451:454-1362(+)